MNRLDILNSFKVIESDVHSGEIVCILIENNNENRSKLIKNDMWNDVFVEEEYIDICNIKGWKYYSPTNGFE